jgi:hypothetical protein
MQPSRETALRPQSKETMPPFFLAGFSGMIGFFRGVGGPVLGLGVGVQGVSSRNIFVGLGLLLIGSFVLTTGFVDLFDFFI